MVGRPRRRPPGVRWAIALIVLVEILAVGFAVRSAVRHRLGLDRPAAHAPPESPDIIERSTTINGVHLTYWGPEAKVGGRAPLVLFSHGFHGSSIQLSFLMRVLARHGYWVVAPDHADASLSSEPEEPFENPLLWEDEAYRDREQDFVKVIRGLQADPDWRRRIDWSRLALVGHALGGYTALGMAGAWPDWKLAHVKAVIALSPYCPPFILNNSLGNLAAPVMYMSGPDEIGITPFLAGKGGAYDTSPSPAYFVELGGAGHFAWFDLLIPYESAIDAYSLAFFDQYVKGGAARYPDAKTTSTLLVWHK